MRKKSVKTAIFFSNTWMVLVTLLIFLFINVCILKIYEDAYKTSLAESSELDTKAYKATEILEESTVNDLQNAEELSEKLGEIGYQTCIMSEQQEVVYSNIIEREIQEYLGDYCVPDDRSHAFVVGGLTVVSKVVMSNQQTIYAVAGEYSDFGEFKNNPHMMSTMLMVFLLDGLLCVGGLLFMSQFFTRRLVRRIMQPLDALLEGVERVKAGVLTEPINYSGNSEFEKICGAFNEMQAHILEEQEKNKRYEKARTDMIAGISHDLRTPLTAIRGTIKGLRDGIATTPETQEKFLDTAYRRTIDMDELLQRLFYFSKLETGNMPVHLERVNITSFMQQYTNEARQTIRDVQFCCDDNCGPLYIALDSEQMKRIMDNLVENSIKYADADMLEIEIKLTTAKDRVKISYSDNGIGVPEEKLPYIFKEFYRCDESRNKKEGSGLGLYIVKYLVESMNGTVSAANLPGLMIEMEFGKDEANE